jgi:hypothetical protein
MGAKTRIDRPMTGMEKPTARTRAPAKLTGGAMPLVSENMRQMITWAATPIHDQTIEIVFVVAVVSAVDF